MSKIDHEAYKKLVDKGFPPEVAEVMITVTSELIESNKTTPLTTKKVILITAGTVVFIISMVDALRYKGGIIYGMFDKMIAVAGIIK